MTATATRFIPPVELSQILCDARAEGDERAMRLIDHIQVLQAALTMREERIEDVSEMALCSAQEVGR